ncbi:hypothetical protein H2198_000218 [Neophaeococcomyces mojaviensis]|uniref:Uncharacterized protein n=1 Tax=Neophaeococcomyces mojaviensis TaxID=3383035 RepID=A0ACC3AKN3_9EURO|nr:hypothetical protein H2198_000218 [Knufia sp. JES_112]
MATNPSTPPNHASRKVPRKPVIPALPLPPSDKKWKRLSVTNTLQETTNPDISPPADDSDETPQEPETVPSTDDVQVLTSQEHNSVDDSEPVANFHDLHSARVEGHDESHVSVDAHINNEPQGAITSTGESTPEEVQEEKAESPGTQIEITLAIPDIVEDHTGPDVVVYEEDLPQSIPDIEDNISHVDTIVDAGARRVRLSEEDTQTSEQEISSMHHSSNTGLTEYSGTPVDSTLEAVSDDPHTSRQSRQLPHRKSEAAPEVLTNGHTASLSTSSKLSHGVNGSTTSQYASVPPIYIYLSKLAYSRQFYDVVIQLNPPDRSFQPSYHYGHSIFLVRSERVAALIPDFDPATQYRVVNINSARNINAHAFEAALRFFYTDEVLTPDALIPKGGFPQKEFKIQNFDYAMSYWFSGVEFGLEAVRNRAYDIVKALVDWDIAEVVMKEAQDLRMADAAIPSTPNKIEIRSIADTLVQIVSQLFVERLNVHGFKLDTEAQVSVMSPRLSQLDMQRAVNNPALSSMVFGSLTTQAEPTDAFVSDGSAILLNMEFKDLANLGMDLVKWHGVEGFNLLQQVVNERESKRDQVVSNRAVQNKERLSNSTAWDTAGWREFTQDGRLERERVGFLIPTRGR